MITENINRIDTQLKERFDSVRITEEVDRSGFHFRVRAGKSVGGKTVFLEAVVPFEGLGARRVAWRYAADTRDPGGHMVEMVSDVEALAGDMLEVVEKGRLDRSYLESLATDEPSAGAEVTVDVRSEVARLVEELGMELVDSRTAVDDGLMVEVATFTGSSRLTDRQRIEMALSAVTTATHMWVGDKLVVKNLI
jgi:hypothetical protein